MNNCIVKLFSLKLQYSDPKGLTSHSFIDEEVCICTLFRKKRFMLDEMTWLVFGNLGSGFEKQVPGFYFQKPGYPGRVSGFQKCTKLTNFG